MLESKNNFRILIVDDDALNIKVIGSFLRKNGFNISFAKSGENALIATKKTTFDLVLLDIMMPEMDGFTVCKKLKENTITQNIPVIFITAKTDPKSIEKGFNMGAVDYITKPYNSVELLARIKMHLELKQKNEQITIANTKLKERNKKITSSIDYAKRIQQALLCATSNVSKHFSEAFVLNIPRDIVSGDFIFIKNHPKTDSIIFAVIDCTGHGVPGAFISIVAHNLLTQICDQYHNYSAAQLLKKLDGELNKALTIERTNTILEDGLEIGLCIYHKKENVIEYAGTTHPLYIIRDEVIIEKKGNGRAIGFDFFQEKKVFRNQKIRLKKNDMLYLFSDGYVDQKGGKDNKKFYYAPFRNLLIDIYKLPIHEQKKYLKNKFDIWKNDRQQTDDVLILGIKIK